VTHNYDLLNSQGVENVNGLLRPESVPVLKFVVPLAQAEAVAIESDDPV
jgi:hypothetical protein